MKKKERQLEKKQKLEEEKMTENEVKSETKNELGTEQVGKLIAKFSIPATISMLVSSLYNIVDQIFIGQGVGLLGNAATNIAFPISIICTATALLLGIGSASNYNLETGAGEDKKACRIMGSGLAALVIGGVCIAVIVLLVFESIAACVRCDRRSAAICIGLYWDHGFRNSVSDFDNRRKSYDPCRSKSDLFHDLYAERRDHQYDSGSTVYFRIPLGNQRSSLGYSDRTDFFGIDGDRLFREI